MKPLGHRVAGVLVGPPHDAEGPLLGLLVEVRDPRLEPPLGLVEPVPAVLRRCTRRSTRRRRRCGLPTAARTSHRHAAQLRHAAAGLPLGLPRDVAVEPEALLALGDERRAPRRTCSSAMSSPQWPRSARSSNRNVSIAPSASGGSFGAREPQLRLDPVGERRVGVGVARRRRRASSRTAASSSLVGGCGTPSSDAGGGAATGRPELAGEHVAQRRRRAASPSVASSGSSSPSRDSNELHQLAGRLLRRRSRASRASLTSHAASRPSLPAGVVEDALEERRRLRAAVARRRAREVLVGDRARGRASRRSTPSVYFWRRTFRASRLSCGS